MYREAPVRALRSPRVGWLAAHRVEGSQSGSCSVVVKRQLRFVNVVEARLDRNGCLTRTG